MSSRKFFECAKVIGHDFCIKHFLLEAQKGSASIDHPSEGGVSHGFKVSLRFRLELVLTATANVDMYAWKPALN